MISKKSRLLLLILVIAAPDIISTNITTDDSIKESTKDETPNVSTSETTIKAATTESDDLNIDEQNTTASVGTREETKAPDYTISVVTEVDIQDSNTTTVLQGKTQEATSSPHSTSLERKETTTTVPSITTTVDPNILTNVTVDCKLCLNNASCQLSNDSRITCTCSANYEGAYCQSDKFKCPSPDHCAPHGKCQKFNTTQVTCRCLKGYTGTNCETNIDECSTGAECHHNADCTDLPGSYNCTCKSGYQGDGTNCRESAIIPFTCTNTFSLNNINQWRYHRQYLSFPFNLGNESYTNFVISPHGYISMGQYNPWMSEFYHSNLDQFDFPFIAGYLTPLDLTGENKVCYDVIYQNVVSGDREKFRNLVDVKIQNFSSQNDYKSEMVVAVHWKDVPRKFPGERERERANFQIIISTDGAKTFIIFNHDKPTWPNSTYMHRYPLSGYTNGKGDSYKVPGSLTREALDFSTQRQEGDSSDVYGRWIVTSSKFDSPQTKCKKWIDQNSYKNQNLKCDMCPPTFEHALNQFWLWPRDKTDCIEEPGTGYKQLTIRFTTRWSRLFNPSIWSHGHCAYKIKIQGASYEFLCESQPDNSGWWSSDWNWQWQLRRKSSQINRNFGERKDSQIKEEIKGGNLLKRYPQAGHLVVYDWSNRSHLEEKSGYELCIEQAGMYEQFQLSRPACNSDNFEQWKQNMVIFRGDPHLMTLDGLQYTFNGLCEFIMTRSTHDNGAALAVHARTVKASTTQPNATSKATVFSSFAARSNFSDIVEVSYNKSTKELDIFVNNTFVRTVNDLDASGEVFNFTGGKVEASSNSSVKMIFDTGTTLEITRTLDFLQMTFQVSSELKGKLEGLMGNYNGDPNDDYKLPNDTVLSPNSTERQLFEFGMAWRLTNESDRLFTYQSGEGVHTHCDTSFQPVYAEEFDSPGSMLVLFQNNSELLQSANKTCQNPVRSVYLSCMYDSAQMQTVEAGSSFMENNEVFTENVKVLANSPPIITMPDGINATVGQPVTFDLNITEPDNDNFTITVEEVVTNSYINGTFNYTLHANHSLTITILSHKFPGFTVTVTDSKHAENAWIPKVYLCSCLHEATCSFHYLQSAFLNKGKGNVFLGRCDCPEKFSGDQCEISPCDSKPSPCFNESSCELVNSTKVTCGPCPSNMTGDGFTCQFRDYCAENLGVCQQECISLKSGFECRCNQKGFEVDSSNSTLCADIDECSRGTHDCKSGQICVNKTGGYDCNCPTGYNKDIFGDCEDINECSQSPSPCPSNMDCINEKGSHKCICFPQYLQPNGSCLDIPPEPTRAPCSSNYCSSGVCSNIFGEASCKCDALYGGPRCTAKAMIFRIRGKLYRYGRNREGTAEEFTSHYKDSSSKEYYQISKSVVDYIDNSMRLSTSSSIYLGCRLKSFEAGSVIFNADLEVSQNASGVTEKSLKNDFVKGSTEYHKSIKSLPGPFFGPANSPNAITVTDRNECKEGSHDCHQHATCSNTVGSFECSCNAPYEDENSSARKGTKCTFGTVSIIIIVFACLVFLTLVIFLIVMIVKKKKNRKRYGCDPSAEDATKFAKKDRIYYGNDNNIYYR